MLKHKVLESFSLPRHHHQHQYANGMKAQRHAHPRHRVQRWLRKTLPRSSNFRLHRLVVAGLVVCGLFRLLAIDDVRGMISEAIFPRYVDGKRCEYMYRSHIESDFYNSEECFSRSDIQNIIIGLVWTLAEVLKRNEIPYWLDSGTLLGAVRDKTMIPHDDDADIGISEASYIKLRDTDLKLELPSEYELQVFEGKFHRQGERDDAIPGRLIHKGSGLYVDVFVFQDSKTDPNKFAPVPSTCFHSCRRCPWTTRGKKEFKIPKNWVYPLQECAFGGRDVSCPARPELYLDHLYGPDFMTPDKKTRSNTRAIDKVGNRH